MRRIRIVIWIAIFIFLNQLSCFAEIGIDFSKKLTSIKNTEKISFTPECLNKLEAKYNEIEKSNLFWEKLSETINESQINNPATKVFGINELKCFLQTQWKEVYLRSTPVGAKVYFKEQGKPFSDFSYDGETPLRKKYQVGTYSFEFRMDGYQTKQVEVVVRKDDSEPIKKRVQLNKNHKKFRGHVPN